MGNFDYNEAIQKFTIWRDAKFNSPIDVKLGIRYYLISYLRRMERVGKNSAFDGIILEDVG